ncbi:MAG: 1-acyl-sn-glycerol-3-phosphate acyltransferase [Bacteroidales bacterium]|jgi:putative hemolysin|nr:1-acyl-sn-glycerol-3-phosphate acyltransferase [Bacteroidales bacterium]
MMAEASKNNHKYIDIEKIISERNAGLLNKLPGFVIKIISKIIYQEEANAIINKYSDSSGAVFLQNLINEFDIKLDIVGLENLPENRKSFFVANHPFGFVDGLILTYIVSGKYGELKAIANDAFMFVPQLHPFIVAVNVFEGSSKEYLRALEQTYGESIAITHFPAGIVSRPLNGKIQDSQWQKSFITKSITYKRDVVPIFFHGSNSKLFYRINRVRRFLGIKANIELMLLPREMFKKRGETIKVTIGEVIPYQTFDKTASHPQWAQKVRSIVYSLGRS